MPDQLRAELGKWDANRDTLISLEEYQLYYAARMQQRGGGRQNMAANVIEEEDIDARTTVLRAGKLPRELPSWFRELDIDKDGQVALWEWRKGTGTLEEFREWDRNDDGLITPEEALGKQRLDIIARAKDRSEDDDEDFTPSPAMMARGGGGKGGKGPKGGGAAFQGMNGDDGGMAANFGGGKKKGGKGGGGPGGGGKGGKGGGGPGGNQRQQPQQDNSEQ